MVKRKSRRPSSSDNPQTLTPKLEEEEEDEDAAEKGGNGFFACYLLTSLSPRHKGQTYIGFTVNPRRRIRQHNGEIGCGAFRTKKKRPWEMVLCIYGFPTNVAALQFEWAWQHPVESLAVRKAAVEFKSLNGLANKIKLAYTMLTLPSWQSLNLTVNFFSTKYTKHYAGCPSLPNQMKVHIRSMDELPCYTGVVDMDEKDLCDDDEECDGTGGANDSLEEGIENVTIVHNSSDPQNSIKESAPENSPRQPSGSPVQSEERIQPFCSAEKWFSLFSNGSYYGTADVADRVRSPSVEECTIELDSPAAQTYPLSTFDNDQPPVKRSAEPCTSQSIKECTIELDSPAVQTFPLSTADNDQRPAEPRSVEVIDVFSPSPEYSSLRRKKRSASSVCPQIIDLTQSPIYV